MTPYDDLLLWASEKREGGLAGLRAACAWTARWVGCGQRGRDILEDLLALGHLDVADGRWSITPPSLALLPDGGGNACFVGARPRWLVEALNDLDRASSTELRALADHIYDYGPIEQRGPSSWFLGTGPKAVLGALAGLGVRVLPSAAEGLLRRVRQRGVAADVRTVRPGELSARLVIEGSVTTGTVTWESVTGDGQPGVYRYMRNHQAVFAERTQGQWLEMDYRWAVWRAAPHSTCVWYEPRSRRLYLPTTVRPPLELERALVMRTGRLPTSGPAPTATGTSATLTAYENMTNAVATHVATLLGKEAKLV